MHAFCGFICFHRYVGKFLAISSAGRALCTRRGVTIQTSRAAGSVYAQDEDAQDEDLPCAVVEPRFLFPMSALVRRTEVSPRARLLAMRDDPRLNIAQDVPYIEANGKE